MTTTTPIPRLVGISSDEVQWSPAVFDLLIRRIGGVERWSWCFERNFWYDRGDEIGNPGLL